jgi:hypothetical protein
MCTILEELVSIYMNFFAQIYDNKYKNNFLNNLFGKYSLFDKFNHIRYNQMIDFQISLKFEKFNNNELIREILLLCKDFLIILKKNENNSKLFKDNFKFFKKLFQEKSELSQPIAEESNTATRISNTYAEASLFKNFEEISPFELETDLKKYIIFESNTFKNFSQISNNLS